MHESNKLGQAVGEITVWVKTVGLDQALDKARELVTTLEKARSLADDLADRIKSTELER